MQRLYVDLDTGIDDAVALALLVRSSIPLAGVGTVDGNVGASTAARNSKALLELLGDSTTPVAVGAENHSEGTRRRFPSDVHGDNGVGGVELPVAGRLDQRSAAQLLVDVSAEPAHTFDILALGPLTNLAAALDLDPFLPGRVGRVTVMGGAVAVAGNVTPFAEANIFADPVAAARVMSADWPVVVVPLDLTMRHVLEAPDRRSLLLSPNPGVVAIGEMLSHYMAFYTPLLGREACPFHDALTAAIAADRTKPTKTVEAIVHVDVSTGAGRGRTSALPNDPFGSRAEPPTQTVVLEVTGDPRADLISCLLGEDAHGGSRAWSG